MFSLFQKENRRLRLDMGYLLLAQVLFVLTNLYINYEANRVWDVEGFAVFNLIKRFGAFVIYPLLVGAGIGIPRYISFLKRRRADQGMEYLWAGIAWFTALFALFAVAMWCSPQPLLRAFGPAAVNRDLWWWAVFGFIFSQGLFVLITAYYRGFMAFMQVAFLNIGILSVFPLVILWLATDVWQYFVYYACFSTGLLMVILAVLQSGKHIGRSAIRLKAIRLFRYGWPRIGAEVGLFGLEFIPVFGVSLFAGLEASACLSLTFILLKLAAMLFELAGSMVLPYYGRLFRNETRAVFAAKVNRLVLYGALAALCIAALFYLLTPFVVSVFFPKLSLSAGYARMVFPVFPVYAVYLLLRNILDIVSDRAYNTFNLLLATGMLVLILAVGIGLGQPLIYQAGVIIGPYVLLGLLTYRRWLLIRK